MTTTTTTTTTTTITTNKGKNRNKNKMWQQPVHQQVQEQIEDKNWLRLTITISHKQRLGLLFI